MMVMRNPTTDSPWPLNEQPVRQYNQTIATTATCELPLWQLVRASTAAPDVFSARSHHARRAPTDAQFIFVDGGVTTYNNPAFLAFQMATTAPYTINWATGVDKHALVSVGTGRRQREPQAPDSKVDILVDRQLGPGRADERSLAGWDMTCRMLGECRSGAPIDREFGT